MTVTPVSRVPAAPFLGSIFFSLAGPNKQDVRGKTREKGLLSLSKVHAIFYKPISKSGFPLYL